MKKSKTQQALDLLRDNPGMSQYRACKTIGVSEAVVSRARKVIKENSERARVAQQGGYLE